MKVIELNSDKVINLYTFQGIFIIDEKNGLIKYALFNSISEIDDSSIKFFDKNKLFHYKYIGCKEIFQYFEENVGGFNELIKKIKFTKTQLKIALFPSIGKIKIEKINLEIYKSKELSKNVLKRKKKVLIVDDSPTIQKVLRKIIESSESLEVHNVANNPIEAKEIILKDKPDLITLDVHMPEMNGVEFLKSFLNKYDIPVVMISSVSIEDGPLIMEALSSGAQTYIQKPSMKELGVVKNKIINTLEALVVKDNCENSLKALKDSIGAKKRSIKFDTLDGLIAIGSSTGGTQALQEVLQGLPDEIPPIVIVQHIPAVFSKALADRLNGLCSFNVKEVEEGDFLEKNNVYIAKGDFQFKLAQRGQLIRCLVTDDPDFNRFKPSVDYLFNSIPSLKIDKLVGVILTGMGKDGAEGLLKLKNIGAKTIGQDEKTCVVYGMPKEAFNIGAVDEVKSLQEIAGEIVHQHNELSKKKIVA
jgi:two-component system chemotaxis response regulator CheB